MAKSVRTFCGSSEIKRPEKDTVVMPDTIHKSNRYLGAVVSQRYCCQFSLICFWVDRCFPKCRSFDSAEGRFAQDDRFVGGGGRNATANSRSAALRAGFRLRLPRRLCSAQNGGSWGDGGPINLLLGEQAPVWLRGGAGSHSCAARGGGDRSGTRAQ